MQGVKPALGFNTKRAAILHLHDMGVPVPIIARDLGSTLNSVHVQLCKAGRKARWDPTALPGGGQQFLSLPKDLIAALRPHAARRDLSSAALAALLIDTIVADGLIDATLDDRDNNDAEH